MRSAAVAALAGAVGAAAFEKFGVFNDLGKLHRSDCGHLDGCGRIDRGGYVPDANTFFLPEKNYEQSRYWDLIARGGHNKHHHHPHHHHHGHHHHHHPHKHHHHDNFRDVIREEEVFSRVKFDFFEESLVFDFEDCNERFERFEFRERAIFEEIEIFIAIEEPNFDRGHRFSLRDGHCRHDDDRHYRCRVPFQDLVHGGYKEMCPIKERGGQLLFIKIRTVIKIREERIEIINREHDNRDYFALSYACSECKHEREEKFIEKDHHRHHHPYHHHRPHRYWPRALDAVNETVADAESAVETVTKPVTDAVDAVDVEARDVEPRGYDEYYNKHRHPGKHHHHHHHPHHHHHDIDYECEGTFLKAYGTGNRCHRFDELSHFSHPKSCGHHHDGYFHRYPKKELEVSVQGPIELDGYKFGHFTVILEKQRDDAFIFIEIKIDDVQYFVTEVAAFIECDGGIDDLSLASTNQPNICKPESYPHRHHDRHGLDSFRFEILDEFKCRGDYFIAIYVLVCVAEDRCEYRKGHYKPYGGDYGYGY